MSIPNEVFWSVLQTGEAVPLAIAGPGTGKTRSVEAFGRAVGRQTYTFIGSISEPTDLGGFPLPVADAGHMAMVPPKWAVSMQGHPWILFLDELTCNAPAVQAAMLRVITDKRVGDFDLPKETWICSACNPPD
jgi:MoxR-like ATPase